MPQAILILGMHRSGTSAVTRVCNVLGAELGLSVIDAGPDNPKGYWENQEIVNLHGKILGELNHPWDSVRPLPENWWKGENLDWARFALKKVIQEHFGGVALWAVKDPRMCLLLPLWLEVLDELHIDIKCLLVKRDPEDIVLSLSARDGYQADHAYLLYLKNLLEVEHHSRDCNRAVISYDSLLSDWLPEVQRVTKELRIDWPAEINSRSGEVRAELDPALRHHHHLREKEQKQAQSASALCLLSADLNLALRNLRDGNASGGFEEVREKLKQMETHASTWLDVIGYQTRFVLEHTKLESIRKTQSAEITKLNELHSQDQTELKKLEGLQKKQGRELRKLEKLRKENRKLIAGLSEAKTALTDKLKLTTAENAHRKVVLASQLEHINALAVDITQLSDSLNEIYASRSWRVTSPLRRFVTRVIVLKHDVRLLYQVLFRSGRLGELLQTAALSYKKLGAREFFTRLPLMYEYLKAFTTRSIPPRIVATDNTVRLLPPEESLASIAGVDESEFADPGIRLHPALNESNPPIDSGVSVIIPTFNAGEEFYWLLRKLVAQKGLNNLEIVVVDSGSTDDTVELARQAGCTVVQISQEEFSHSYARNLGADTANNEYLLFIVQDAYPIGDLWAYGMLAYLQDHKKHNVVAVSCSEYCRSDSDIMYDCNVDTHYRFLRCRDVDRIGEYMGSDHMSLRSWGQLSDVSCMLSKELFGRYKYRGDYAEDLDLGIRLIRDSYRIAMLASVKTIHSHNRPAYYYLKRSFVDVIFLVRQFKDFNTPPVGSLRGLMFGIVVVAERLSTTLREFDFAASNTTLESSMQQLIAEIRGFELDKSSMTELDLEDTQLADYIISLRSDYLDDTPLQDYERPAARAFVDGFIGRMEHFRSFANKIYLQQDASLRHEVYDMLRKTFAATAGSYLGFLYLEYQKDDGANGDAVKRIKSVMGAGI